MAVKNMIALLYYTFLRCSTYQDIPGSILHDNAITKGPPVNFAGRL